MIKLIGIEIPKMVFEQKNKELTDIADFKNFNDKIFVIKKVKELPFIEFNNEFLQKENEENNQIINQDIKNLNDFLVVDIPSVMNIWNEFNETKLKELKEKEMTDENISGYFQEKNLTFPDQVSIKILYI